MDENEKLNLLRVLENTITAIKNKDIKLLKELSNQTIHDASILQESHSITIAVLVYTLAKIYERQENYESLKSWNNLCVACDTGLEDAKKKLQNNDFKGFDDSIKNYILALGKLDKKLKSNISDVLNRAKINKASRIYEHGISIGRTADLLGISKFELMEYVGRTYIADVKEGMTMSVKKRLNIARGLFV